MKTATRLARLMTLCAVAGLVTVTTTSAWAEGQGKSLLPKPRPAQVAATVADAPVAAEITVSSSNALPTSKRPLPRPAGLVANATPDMTKIDPASVQQVALVTPRATMKRPLPRPDDLDTAAPGQKKDWSVVKAAAVRTVPGKAAVLPKKGSVCGDASIRGKALAPITSRVKGCGVEDPVEVTEIAGVALSPAATITCETAVAAKRWIERGVQPAFDNQVAKLQIAGSYVCRPRNGIRGNKVSEHGRGRALDISAIVLKSGDAVSVAGDYRKSKALKAAHKAACGPFGTTLGPGSDGHHEDHLHVDIVSYRNGTYCR